MRSKNIYHLSLIDPGKTNPNNIPTIVKKLEREGTDCILVGGSDSLHTEVVSNTITSIKRNTGLKVIQIIRDASEIDVNSDGVIVPLVLNSYDVSYCLGIATNSIHILKELGMPYIPIGYILIGFPSTASFVTKTIPVPKTRPKIIKHLAVAAEGIGLRALYLEGGSGSPTPIPEEFIKVASENTSIPIMVGGGIKTGRQARAAINAGANIIVTGSVIEEKGTIREIMRAIREMRRTI
ncbi:MAG: geranylgeranylglyceryl/heptaprenylglyceryl phosphate synthase [Candidatus Micrarchaeaceae archaeon]